RGAGYRMSQSLGLRDGRGPGVGESGTVGPRSWVFVLHQERGPLLAPGDGNRPAGAPCAAVICYDCGNDDAMYAGLCFDCLDLLYSDTDPPPVWPAEPATVRRRGGHGAPVTDTNPP